MDLNVSIALGARNWRSKAILCGKKLDERALLEVMNKRQHAQFIAHWRQ